MNLHMCLSKWIVCMTMYVCVSIRERKVHKEIAYYDGHELSPSTYDKTLVIIIMCYITFCEDQTFPLLFVVEFHDIMVII